MLLKLLLKLLLESALLLESERAVRRCAAVKPREASGKRRDAQ